MNNSEIQAQINRIDREMAHIHSPRSNAYWKKSWAIFAGLMTAWATLWGIFGFYIGRHL